MEEMNALERQLTGVVQGAMRPPRPVDATAIARSAASEAPIIRWPDITSRLRGGTVATSQGGFHMFSAIKFVAAGVIVALFGGFLLAGALTTQQGDDEAVPAAVSASPSPEREVGPEPSVAPTDEPEPAVPSVRMDILPGVPLLTLELEPDILQILDDGVREPEIDPHWRQDGSARSVHVGQAGTVWLANRDGFYRLGDEEMHKWPSRTVTRVNVTADDRVWAWSERNGRARLRSFDGGQWKTQVVEERARHGRPWTLVADDGTVWRAGRDPASTKEDPATIVSRFEGGEWQQMGPPVKGFDGGRVHHVDGGVWLSDGEQLTRLADGEWQWHAIPDRGYGQMAFTPGGVVWHVTTRPHLEDGGCATGPNGRALIEPAVTRFDGSTWSAWDWDSGVVAYEEGHWDLLEGMVAAPDGSLWLPRHYLVDEEHSVGITRFDGVAWQHFLPGRSVAAVDFGIDGAAWLQTSSRDEPDQHDLVVILPEAIEATEERPATRTTAPVLTTRPPQIPLMARSDVLPGVELSTREIEPGVLRVLHDSVRDLWPEEYEAGDVEASSDGDIWLSRDDRLLRLGGETASRRTRKHPGTEITVAPDGTVWKLAAINTVTSYDGKRWVKRWASAKKQARAFDFTPDGTVWAVWVERDSKTDRYRDRDAVFGYLDGDRWRVVDRWAPAAGFFKVIEDVLTVTDSGEVLGLACTHAGCGLGRYLDGAWEEVLTPAPGQQVAVGPDGTAWLDTDGYPTGADADTAVDRGGSRLQRFDGAQWESWEPGTGAPDTRDWGTSRLWVSPDGDLWANPNVETGESCAPDRRPDGLFHFDGISTTRYLRDHAVDRVAFAPDGSAWVVATDPNLSLTGLYVITPEAVAASG